jgi:hypothetical protein
LWWTEFAPAKEKCEWANTAKNGKKRETREIVSCAFVIHRTNEKERREMNTKKSGPRERGTGGRGRSCQRNHEREREGETRDHEKENEEQERAEEGERNGEREENGHKTGNRTAAPLCPLANTGRQSAARREGARWRNVGRTTFVFGLHTLALSPPPTPHMAT